MLQIWGPEPEISIMRVDADEYYCVCLDSSHELPYGHEPLLTRKVF